MTLSKYLSDADLSEVLAGCTTGQYEAWLPHPTLPYLVSSFGRIWSRQPGPRGGKYLTPYGQNGYPAICIGGKNVRVHVLVLETFIGPRPDDLEGCHWDNVKTNNILMNLRWDDRLGNAADRWREWRDRREHRHHLFSRERHQIARKLAVLDRLEELASTGQKMLPMRLGAGLKTSASY